MNAWKQRLRDRQLIATANARWQRPDRGGSVYLIRIGEMVKIGRSVNPELRIRQMQLPHAPDVASVIRCDTTADSLSLERALHERYAAHRQHGEWFTLTTDQTAEAVKFAEDWLRA